MSREMTFFMYLTERYAEYKETTSGEILKEWDKLEITKKIYALYELYHTEAIENAFADIDRLVKEAKNS
ncbi:MAG: DUF3791 domain-containing protein [Clostridia bacterium]|nr:DUF3791 domain-containing protein [Clostridia bacterium]MBP3441500.1 DUF3791 domain-containing protein [Clostridia bacterium]